MSAPLAALFAARTRAKETPTKPPYVVPSMADIAALPWNGFNVASTFSGCGGSSLGYKLAGFRVLYANEFVPEAQETYRANHPRTHLDTRDIRSVKGADILAACKLEAGALDVLDGSPPCASFSMSGSREANWGKVKGYSDTQQRTDDLFFEFTRILREVQPKTFIAENVAGLVRGTAKGYFKEILGALKEAGYAVSARKLDAQWLGVPQHRERLIFVGVREDIALAPVHPEPLPYCYSVQDVLPHVSRVKHSGMLDNWKSARRPCPTVVASGGELSPTAYFSGGVYIEADAVESAAWLDDYAIGAEWDKLAQGEWSAKYQSLIRSDAKRPALCITAAGGNPGTAAVTHPTERRKFSIRELRLLCSFPADFILTGTYAQQWERLGRAVPPLMMSRIAAALRDGVLARMTP